jgi:hypothetical protein
VTLADGSKHLFTCNDGAWTITPIKFTVMGPAQPTSTINYNGVIYRVASPL